MAAPRRSIATVLVLLSSIALAGCEEDVVVVTGIDQPFSVYGILTPQADTQWVAVYAIEDRLQPVTPAPLDATVRSTDLSTTALYVWNEEVVRDSLGLYTHVYWSPFAAEYGHPYRIEVERSDGARTFVEASVPALSELVLPPQQIAMPTLFPVRIVGDAPVLIRIEVTYRVKFIVGSTIVEETYFVSYDGRAQKSSQGWVINVNVFDDMRTLKSILIERGAIRVDTELKPVELRIRLIVADEAWDPPGGVFDPEVLVQPGLFSNVENGFGFVGAGYRLSGKWAPLDSILTVGSRQSLVMGHGSWVTGH